MGYEIEVLKNDIYKRIIKNGCLSMGNNIVSVKEEVDKWVESGMVLYMTLLALDDGSSEINDLQDVIINGLGGRIYMDDDAS